MYNSYMADLTEEVNSKEVKEFNNGLMTKYAYHIKHVYKINKILDLKYLREKYNFRPPQAFMYTDNYKELIEEILNIKKDKIR